MNSSDIELGAKPVRVRRQKKKSDVVVSVRLSSEDADAISDLAWSRRVYTSQLLRQIVQDYLAKPAEVMASVPRPYFQHDTNTIGYPVRVTWGNYN